MVTTVDVEPPAVDAQERRRWSRRAEVVERLLERGVRPTTLQALLPGWERLVDEVARSDRLDIVL